MKLATLRDGTRDGALIVVNRDLTKMTPASHIAHTLQAALDDWSACEPKLRDFFDRLQRGEVEHSSAFDSSKLLAPLPRAYGWIDGTSYLSHMERARALRGAKLPDDFRKEPLMGERTPGRFFGPQEALPLLPGDIGMDIEGEIGVILDDVPLQVDRARAGSHIRLITLVNDVSLRTVLAETIKRGRSATLFAKPYPTMAPVAVTPDELGAAWDGELLKLRLHCHINGKLLGRPDGGKDASFGYPELVSYCARYKPLPAGTVLAAGTLSNYDDDAGGACIAERRMIEVKQTGSPITPYLQPGDELRIEMLDPQGKSIFGAIQQRVEAAQLS
jgi:fumarylacetoacetate (FAA) hydrolase